MCRQDRRRTRNTRSSWVAPLPRRVRPRAIPGPLAVAARAATLVGHAFNPDGIGWQLMASLGRVLLGFGIAVGAGVPLGLLIGLLPRLNRVLDPYIQILKPISPLAWMPARALRPER